jgi:hypothetical protein
VGYASIDNLYKNRAILLEPQIYALEKIDGTSASVAFNRNQNIIHYHGGCVQDPVFKALFDPEDLEAKFHQLAGEKITIYGEAYGGKVQKGAWRYGPNIKFVAFEVKVDDQWLAVPEAEKIVLFLGLEFVHYVRISTKLSEIDFWRDATSEQAIRNGVTTADGPFIRREGVILRAIDEKLDGRGNRIIAKHKRDEERETKTPRIVDTAKIEKLLKAREIAEEWVVENRLLHVLSHLEGEIIDMARTKEVISEMLKDVHREGEGEFEPSPEVNAEIGKRTSQLLKAWLQAKLHESQTRP